MTKLALAVAALLTTSQAAHALQPLAEFLAAGHKTSVDLAEAQAALAQQRAQADVAFGRALPGISLRGTYTRNQYDSVFALQTDPARPPVNVTLLPHDQLDGFVTLSVPLVDLASFKRIEAARTTSQGADVQLRVVEQQIDAQVVQAYYQLVANLALLEASRSAQEVAKESLALTINRAEAGSAAQLDVERARAELESRVQQVAAAQLGIELAARTLRTASSIEPELRGPVALQDDLHGEGDLGSFESKLKELPAIEAAQLSVRAAEQQAEAQRLTLVPALAATVAERLTNAPGFTGHEATWQAVVALTWGLDFTTFATTRAQDAVAAAARAREHRAELVARDAIHREWSSVGAAIARSRSARAQVKAASLASTLARDRYEAGASTQLDLLQAQRDAFAADVARIQADADLVNARAQLRISSGQELAK